MLKRFGLIGLLASYFLFALIYIHPGEKFFLTGSSQAVLSDGTDSLTFPHSFYLYIDLVSKNFFDGIWGGVFFGNLNYPDGTTFWMSALERIQILFFSIILPLEQITTAFVLIGMTLNGFFMFLLGRELEIPKSVSWLMGFSWAFSAYTRARAKVHMGLVGIYHIPLLFLSLLFLFRKDKRQTFFAAIALLAISFFPHYYVVITFCLLPFAVYFIYRFKPTDIGRMQISKKSLLVVLPAFIWLTFSLLFPINPTTHSNVNRFPPTGKTHLNHHPFLDFFSLEPVDLFTGDIGVGTSDIIPFKQSLNESIANSNYGGSNAHERAHGTRWIIWIITIAALFFLLPSKKTFWLKRDYHLCIYFFVLSLFFLWLALPPGWPIEGFGGSNLIHQLIPQIRVPNRAAIGISFCLIVISGLFLKNLILQKRIKQYANFIISALGFLILVELLPFYQSLPITKLAPRYHSLQSQDCAPGMLFPYASSFYDASDYYLFLNQMRGNACPIINRTSHDEIDTKLFMLFSTSRLPVFSSQSIPKISNRLKEFVNCTNLGWIAMGNAIDEASAKSLCLLIGWKWGDDRVCHNLSQAKFNIQTYAECLK